MLYVQVPLGLNTKLCLVPKDYLERIKDFHIEEIYSLVYMGDFEGKSFLKVSLKTRLHKLTWKLNNNVTFIHAQLCKDFSYFINYSLLIHQSQEKPELYFSDVLLHFLHFRVR